MLHDLDHVIQNGHLMTPLFSPFISDLQPTLFVSYVMSFRPSTYFAIL